MKSAGKNGKTVWGTMFISLFPLQVYG